MRCELLHRMFFSFRRVIQLAQELYGSSHPLAVGLKLFTIGPTSKLKSCIPLFAKSLCLLLLSSGLLTLFLSFCPHQSLSYWYAKTRSSLSRPVHQILPPPFLLLCLFRPLASCVVMWETVAQCDSIGHRARFAFRKVPWKALRYSELFLSLPAGRLLLCRVWST